MSDVSRETSERLDIFARLLAAWTKKINLIAPSTVDQIHDRHIADSLQIYPLAPPGWKKWVDLGSGGGLPGVIVAICAMDAREEREIVLVESDARKCAFLRTAIRETGARATVIQARIGDLAPAEADVLSARALAPLERLLSFSDRHLSEGGIGLFHKGRQVDAEIEQALDGWTFACEKVPSKTDADGVVLRIGGVKRA